MAAVVVTTKFIAVLVLTRTKISSRRLLHRNEMTSGPNQVVFIRLVVRHRYPTTTAHCRDRRTLRLHTLRKKVRAFLIAGNETIRIRRTRRRNNNKNKTKEQETMKEGRKEFVTRNGRPDGSSGNKLVLRLCR